MQRYDLISEKQNFLSVFPKGGHEDGEDGCYFQSAEVHCGGEYPLGCNGNVGITPEAAVCSETGTGVEDAGNRCSEGFFGIHSEENEGEYADEQQHDEHKKNRHDVIHHVFGDYLAIEFDWHAGIRVNALPNDVFCVFVKEYHSYQFQASGGGTAHRPRNH